jgi:hypothetical protein
MSDSYRQFGGNPYGSGETYAATGNPYGGGGVSHGVAWRMRDTRCLTDTICSTARNQVRDLRCTRRSQTIRSSLPMSRTPMCPCSKHTRRHLSSSTALRRWRRATSYSAFKAQSSASPSLQPTSRPSPTSTNACYLRPTTTHLRSSRTSSPKHRSGTLRSRMKSNS